MSSSADAVSKKGHQSVVPAAKLTPPVALASQVLRSAVLERVASTVGDRLVLVRAAAGFGKTTLMAQLQDRLAEDGVDTAWLTLDAADNDTVRFLTGLQAALSGSRHAPGADGALLDTLDWLATRTSRYALFLDDFEFIREPSVLALVRTLVDRLPRGCRVVIGSRSLPDLSLARLRAHGQLVEVDTDALRFSPEETVALASRMPGERPSDDALARLHRKTEGWVTALRLALNEGGGPDLQFLESFSGSARAIAEYLAEDVFARQPEDARVFMLHTSILRHLEVPLCQALLQQHDVARILAGLEQQSVFLVALPGATPAWRYDRLFGAFLHNRLEQSCPEDVPRLHLLASAWYEANGRPVPAIIHAIEGADYPLALSLLERHARPMLEEGRMRLLARWFEAIPGSAMNDHPRLQAVAVWATMFTQGPLQAAAQLTRSNCEASTDPQVQAHVNAQRPLLAAMSDRYDEAMALGRDSLARLPTDNPFADGVLRNCMAHVFAVLGETVRAQQLIDEARHASGDRSFNRMYAESIEGMLDLQNGRLRLATSRFRSAVSATRASSHNYASGNAWAGILYASTLYEAGDFDTAEQLVNVYLPIAADVGMPGHTNAGYMVRARIAFSRGDIDRAFESLTDLEYLAQHRQLPRIVANAKLERGRLLLLQGNAQASLEELQRADNAAVWERLQHQRLPANEIDYLALARMRWNLHFGDARATLPQIESELAQAVEQNRLRRALRLRTLQGLALQRSGDPAGAARVMVQVVRQAMQEGFVRLIADEGPEVGRIVQRLYAMQQQMPANRSDRAFLEYLTRLLNAFGRLPEDLPPAQAGSSIMEPLTRKEIQVLQLAADGYSNAAMAEKLEASDSTVRTHLRSINTKFAARSRAEAVAIGRRLGVIR